MPRFETPGPISLGLKLGMANVYLSASERSDTTVEVVPTDPGRKGNVEAAAETRVDYENGRLSVRDRSPWRQMGWWGKKRSVDVRIELPSGSHVTCDAVMGTFDAVGRLGECRVTTGAGNIRLDEAGPAQLDTGLGDVMAAHVLTSIRVKTGTGTVRLGQVDGTAAIDNANGATEVGGAAGQVDVHSANGRIIVNRAHGSVVARSAMGDVNIGQVEAGSVTARTAWGRVDIGIRDGVSAWLDLETKFGHVQSDLDRAEEPAEAGASVEVHVHTAMGDIRIHRVARTA